MVELVFYKADWCGPCRKYWPKVLVWATELDAKLTKVDMSSGFIDGIQSVPTMDVIVGGELKLRVTHWGPGTRKQVLEVLS